MQVGFIGVGRMGTAMARNLLRAGHRVLAWDVSRDALDRIKRDGAAVAGSAREAFSGDAVISMLPNDAAMRATFIVDPHGTITFASCYHDSVGRNAAEVLRALDALQSDELCPCNWQKGEETIKLAA